jgi:hypothetical protein
MQNIVDHFMSFPIYFVRTVDMNEEINLDVRRDVDPNTLYELSVLLGEGSYWT